MIIEIMQIRAGRNNRIFPYTMERIFETIIESKNGQMRLDRFLADRFTYLSRTGWQREIDRGKVTVNGRAIRSAHHRLAPGDRLCYDGLNFEEPPVDAGYRVLHEDRDLIAINKTGNLPVHPSGCFFRNTLLVMLEDRAGARLYPVHRLDRETSGVILYAKSPEIAAVLQERLRHACKRYIAVVHGSVAARRFTVDIPIGGDTASAVRNKRAAFSGATEAARTDFTTLYATDRYSVLAARLHTGRLHQIRVHLRAVGHPVVGDKLYAHEDRVYLEFTRAGLTDELLATLELPRMALHARRLVVEHPRTKRVLVFRAPLPDDLRSFIRSRVRDV